MNVDGPLMTAKSVPIQLPVTNRLVQSNLYWMMMAGAPPVAITQRLRFGFSTSSIEPSRVRAVNAWTFRA
jgi:hypothetical protein